MNETNKTIEIDGEVWDAETGELLSIDPAQTGDTVHELAERGMRSVHKSQCALVARQSALNEVIELKQKRIAEWEKTDEAMVALNSRLENLHQLVSKSEKELERKIAFYSPTWITAKGIYNWKSKYSSESGYGTIKFKMKQLNYEAELSVEVRLANDLGVTDAIKLSVDRSKFKPVLLDRLNDQVVKDAVQRGEVKIIEPYIESVAFEADL